LVISSGACGVRPAFFPAAMNDENSLTAVRLEKRAALEAAGLRP